MLMCMIIRWDYSGLYVGLGIFGPSSMLSATVSANPCLVNGMASEVMLWSYALTCLLRLVLTVPWDLDHVLGPDSTDFNHQIVINLAWQSAYQ